MSEKSKTIVHLILRRRVKRRKDKGRLLMIRESGGHWCLPYGESRLDETPRDTAFRVAREIVSVDLDNAKLVCLAKSWHKDGDSTLTEIFFVTDYWLGYPTIGDLVKYQSISPFRLTKLPENIMANVIAMIKLWQK